MVSNSTSAKQFIRKSSRAVCHPQEREMTVLASRVGIVKNRLKRSGFMIIGTSEPFGRTRKIWFIRRGAIL